MKILIDEVIKYNLSILALQEVRWPGKGSVKSGNHTILYFFFYIGSKNNRHENGVGFLVSDSILPNIKTFTAINERICVVHIKEKIWDIVLLNCYAPTEDKNNEIKSNFYENLENAYDSLPRNTVKIVEDFNAQIGREPNYRPTIGQVSLHMMSNDKEVRAINFAVSKDLVVSSTFFPRKDIHKQTCVSPNTINKSQVDHVIIDKQHKYCITNVRS